ncbi:MAG TPA: Calx-beta domain-containing protein [Pyrinomonadaceae bacterium]|nr:Calx-beta domain-containing protein [Pyrinomonadaceae bacterium]
MPRFNRSVSRKGTTASTARSSRNSFLKRIAAPLSSFSASGKRRLGVFVAALCVCAVVASVFVFQGAKADVTFLLIGVNITENFDGIGSSGTAALPTGWRVDSVSASPTTNYALAATATTQSAGNTNFTTGGTYNFANGVNATSTERAVGWLSSGSYSNPRNLFVQLTNNTNLTVNSLTVNYDIEKYRSGTPAFNINFFSSLDGVNWTAQAAGDHAFPADANSTTYTNPPSTTPKTVAITGLNLAQGANIYLRWSYTGALQTSAQALGIDNFSAQVNVTPSALQFRSIATGNWNATSTWEMSVDGTNWLPATMTPTASNGAIAIRNGHTVTVTATVIADELAVNTGALLLVNNGVTLQIPDNAGTDLTIDGLVGTAGNLALGGTAQVNGTLRLDEGGFLNLGSGTYAYDQTTGTLAFNTTTTASVDNTSDHWPTTNGPQNVSVASGGISVNAPRTIATSLATSGGISTAGNLTLNGLFRIFNGGFVSGSPTYGSASTLSYFTGTTYGRAGEWLPGATSNPGYPANIEIGANTTLDLPNGGVFDSSTSQMAGNLTIDAGSTLSMGAMNQQLTVVGNVNINGTLTLSTSGGGDFRTQGNWTDTGTFNHNGRGVYFDGSAPLQTISKSGGETFGHLLITKPTGSLQLLSNVAVSATSGGALQLVGAATFDLNGNSLSLTGNGGDIFVALGPRTITSTGATSAILFQGSKTIDANSPGTLTFGNCSLELNAPVDFGPSLSTINNSLTINAGGSVINNGPTYGSSSTLVYNTPAGHTTGVEWGNGTSGVGVPNNVTIQATTGTVAMGAGTRTVLGNMTITSGTLAMGGVSGDLHIKGNWANTGNFSPSNRTVHFDGTGAQSITKAGGETFYDLIVDKSSNSLTLNNPVNVDGLALTNGNVNTSAANLLTVTSTAANRLSGGSATSYVNGPLARVFPAGLATGTIYRFPIGKAGFNLFELVNPTTNAGGTVTLMAEEFDGDSGGTAGTGLTALNTNRYWSASITSGGANFINTTVRLTDAGVTAADAIGKSATQAGTYDSIDGTVVGQTILSDPFSSFSFFVIGTAAAPCVAPSTVYVDDDWAGETPGNDPDGGGAAVNFGCDSFATIQDGINGVAPSGTVIVAAGNYFENPTVNKAVTLQGANVGTAGSAARVAESNVRTLGASQTAVFSVTSNNVTIDGFQIDGDDPGQPGAPLTSGENTNVSYGVRPTGAFNNITVRNNIIRRVAIGFRGDGASQNNTVTANWFDSVGFFDFGYAVSLRGNYYANVTFNRMTRAWTGVHLNNHNGAGGPASFNITDNEIHAYAGGILYWLQYNGATGATISSNTITAEPTAVANNFGILVVSNQDAVSSTVTSNAISGHNYGIGLFNVPTTNNITIGATNSISGATLAGVLLTDNLNFNPVGTTNFLAGGPGATSTVNLNGLSITGNTGDGLKVEGGTNVQTLNATGVTVTGTSGTRGLEFVGGFATANVTSSTFTGFGTGIALLDSSSQVVTGSFNRIISTTTAIDNPNNQTANLQNNWWGCNGGPGQPGCGAVNGLNANFNPWIVLLGSATPSTITPGGSSTIDADMTHNSAGGIPVGTLPNMPVAWSATNGAMVPTSGTMVAGAASSVFTSSNSSDAMATILVDSQNTNINVNVDEPSFAINDVAMSEGNSGTTLFTFTITKTGTTAFSTSVDYATADGTAVSTGGSPDFTAITTTTVNFAPGDTTQQFSVSVNGDTAVELNEAFTVNLTNASGATISDASGTGTINNDDTCAVFTTVYVDDSWVGTAPGADPDAGGPATSFGCDSFATIQDGVTAVSAGGIVIVRDGSYTENVTITKAMSLRGHQFGVDARGRAASESTVSPAVGTSPTFTVAFNGLIVIDGFSFTGGPTGASGVIFTSVGPNDNMQISNNRFSGYPAAAVWMNRGGFDITIDKNIMDGSGIAGGGQAIFANGPQSYPGLNITNNNVINHPGRYGFFVDGNNNVGESATRAALISGNLFDGNLQSLNLGSRSFGKLGTPLLGTYAGTISNNTFSNNTANGIQAGIQHVLVTGNTFSNNAVDGLALTSFGNTGADRGAQNSVIVSNYFTGNVRAGIFFSGTQGVGLIGTNRANFNRLIGNGVGIQYGGSVAAGNNATIDVTNNWWGCNFGPGVGGAGCTGTPNGTLVFAGNTGVLDADPWIVLGTSASPNPTTPGGTSTVTAEMRFNSDAVDTSASGTVPQMPVTFSATEGTILPAASTISSGQATSTFTSTSLNSGTACSTVDGQLVCTTITLTLPSFSIDDVTLAEGNGGPGTTLFTFTITKTGATAFSTSVEYATADGTAVSTGGSPDFTAIPATPVTLTSAETTKQFSVLVNGDTTFEATEAFAVNLTNASGANISDSSGTGTITNDDACAVFTTVYVDDNWVGTPIGSDPDAGGPATVFGCDSFATIQGGVNGVSPGGTVQVAAGTYDEDVAITNAGLQLLGAGAGTTNIRGPIGGAGATVQIAASNVTVAGFTITRLGNNTTDWNNPALNSTGIAIQGQSITGALIRDNIITGNRTGLDINNSNGHAIRNNVIDFNRTGFIFRNQTDNMTVVENFITNNWTVGVLFLDASGGTNSPVQTAAFSTFSNNNISANWYGQIVDRQAGGSLPAAGTNAKNFRGNWFGTTSPATTTSDSTEPGYAAQIPVAYGGTATPPGGQPDIAGPGSANFRYTPFLQSGTDTNVETTPGRGTFGFQGVGSNVTVSPSNLNGWIFFDDFPGTGTGTGGFEPGPGTAPLGEGSAFLQVDSLGRHALGTGGFGGTRMNHVTDLSYSSYQNTLDPNFAISLQFEIDWDLNDAATAFAGRLVFEPYLSPAQGAVQQNVWQPWNALAGNWYGTRTTVTVNNVSGVAQPCQPATPCTWAQVLALFPNAGIRNTPTSPVLFKAGGPWAPNFDGNVDAFLFGINASDITYDFEPNPGLSINDLTQAEGNAGQTAYSFTVTLSRASDQIITVNYATADDSATAPSDYTAVAPTTLTFNPGETSKPAVVQVNGDTALEPDEQFFVNLSNVSASGEIRDPQGVGTITNDDSQFSIDDVTLAEGNPPGTTAFNFTITRTGFTGSSASVEYATVNGTATAPSDFTAILATPVTFLSGESTKPVTVLVNRDYTVEPNEAFTVQLSNPSGATISDADGTGTITNDDTAPPVVYVDDSWIGVPLGTDPDAGGPATAMGYDAFATVQEGINGVAAGGIVNVIDGTYLEDVTIAANGTRLLGFGPGVKTIRGAIGGPSGATILVQASNVTIAGLTITRDGNTVAQWNDPNLNSTGIAIQGLSLSGTLIRDNVIDGNRTGIDVNNSNSHTIRNNTIDNNRTGMIFRNQTEGITVVENFITNNWTVGIVFLDASLGSNVPVQSAVGSVFNNNDLSGNWYGQIVDRQTGGSLPAPNTTNLKNFRGNWLGTTAPVVTTANSAEPGYAAQIPVIYGGTAVPPGGQPDIAGPASANVKYIPFLQSGTDTNVETVPGRGTNGFQGVPSDYIVVRETNLKGWTQQHSTCGGTNTGSQAFVVGPGTPPVGEGSLQFTIGSNGNTFETIRTADYNNVRLDTISSLSYSTYVVQDGTGGQAPYLLLNIDFNGDNMQDDQIFFEPVYQHAHTVNVPDQGALVVGTWQSWNAQAGGWWSTGNIAGAGPGANVKTIAQYLAVQPNARILHPAAGTGGFRIATGCGGGAWPNFIGNADNLRVGLSAANTRYDFEPLPRLTIDDVTHAEGNSGTTDYTFTITLSAASDQTVTVDYGTGDVSATQPSDYTQLTTTTLTFNPGETTKNVTVSVNGDTEVEPDETFTLNLSNAVNATITDASGIGTITNDDTDVSVAVSPLSVNEDGVPNLVYTFTRTGVTTGSVTANFSVGGTANPANDYTYIPGGSDTFTPPSGTVTFGPTVTAVTVTIDPTADISYEPNETVVLTVTSGTGYNPGTPSVATGTITNDDVIPATLVVTKTDDTNDGFCSLDDCSLREAITNANANADASTINFNIPNADPGRNLTTGVYTITLGSALPAITQAATIDGYSQEPCPPSPAVPCSRENTLAVGSDALLLIEIDATNAGGYGLVVDASNTLLKGLVMNRATQSEIWLRTGTDQAVRGSYLGTDAAGAADLGNTVRAGVEINGNNNNAIGGPNAADRNVVSGGNGSGIFIINGASNNTIQNNYIGTDKSGLLELQNTGSGVIIDNRTNNTIRGNVISGNDADGVLIRGDFTGLTTPNQILGNIIGLKANGTEAMGNIGSGVKLQSGATNHIIGGTSPGDGNIIAFNGGDGVSIASGVNTSVRGNSIFTNGTFANGNLHLGIDLDPDGVTPNDANDPDTGSNDLQNFPVIRAAQVATPNVIRGTLNSTPSQTFTIDFYRNSACDASGNGEGQTWMGSTTTNTGANGDGLWSFSPAVLNPGDVITATATNATGSTSEFSACFTAAAVSFGEIKFAAANTNDTETNAGTHTANIVVQRVNGADRAVSVTYTITDGTAQDDNPATEDNDYSVVLATGTLNWANGDASDKNIPITVNGDTKFELDETVNITLSAPTGGATITGPTAATLTIQNDDTTPVVSINDVTQVEGNGPGTTGFTFTVSLSNASYQAVTVNYQTQDGTTNPAIAGTDYTAIASTLLTFDPDETSKPVTVQVNGDTTYEENETFFVNLSSPSNATSGDMQGLGTITNDDPQPTISIDDVTHVEGNVSGVDNDPDLTNYDFTVTLSNPSYQTITVEYATANNTAVAPGDFNAVTTTTLTFLPGETSKPLTVVVKGDTIYELDETFFVNLSNPTNATTTDQGVGTITNDDDAPTLAIGDRTLNEGTTLGVSTSFNFTVTKNGSTEVTATVNFATAPGSATANVAPCPSGDDYQTQNGSLSFLAGETTKTITVPVCKDSTFEGNETFFVNLSGEAHSTVTDSQGLGTILNDDIPSSGFTVNTTDDLDDTVCDGTHCSLREAIIASNGSATAVAINFAIPASDLRHFYYQDDSTTGQVTLANVANTIAADDSTIGDIDPDWPHSWWSILPGSQLPSSTKQVLIDGYSQTGAVANSLANSTNAVLRIELNGSSAGLNSNGLIISGGTSTLRGLAINRFQRDGSAPTPAGNGASVTSGSNSISGNFIGTDVSGTLDLGNGGSGIIATGFTTSIGGPTPDIVNLISGNALDGVTFSNSNSNVVLGNFIGTAANGASGMGNGANGISFVGLGAVANTVGGTSAGERNIIAFNAGDGLNLSTASFGNGLRGNSIFSNGTTSTHLGIDLGTDGITANDAADGDSGPNSLQNFPVITLAQVTGSTRTITGTLNSTPTEAFNIDFYQSPSCDNSGNGEGMTFLGSITTDPTDASGDVSFTFHPSVLTVGQVVTATATSTVSSFSTSEFSQCFTVNDGSPGAGDIQFTSATYTVSESATTASITVTRVGGTNGSVTANFSTSDGSAQAPGDYSTVTNFPITYVEGEMGDKTVTVPIADNSAFELSETVNLSLSSTTINRPESSAPSVFPYDAVLTITDDDTAPSFAIDDVTLLEGTGGATSYVFTVTKTGSTLVNATVDYATSPNTATSPSDFGALLTTTLTFLPADTSKQVTVLVNGDSTVEPPEDFAVNLSNATNATISDGVGTGTITNDDTDVTVAVSPSAAAEDGASNLVYTFTRTGVTSGAITVNFSVGGTASATDYTESGADTFSATSGTITFGAGVTTKQVTLDPAADNTVEPDETVVLTVTAGTGYNVGSPSVATGTITNDDTDVTVAVSPSTASEDGAPNLVYTFTRNGVSTGALTVNFSVGGTATFTSDYTQIGAATFTATTGTVTFGAGNTTAQVTLDPLTDSTVESDETAILTVTSGTGYNVANPSAATGTITNDDTDVTLAVSPSTVSEDGAPTLVYTFTRNGVTAGALTVNFSVAGTAGFTTDYTQTGAASFSASSGTVTFGAGNTTATVTLDPVADTAVESDETAILTLTSGTGYNVSSPSSATGTITNDDTDITVAVSPSSVTEDGVPNLVYTFTRNGVTSGALTVNFAVSGTAGFATDYTQTGAASFSSSSGTVTFSAGASTATVTIDPATDTTAESNETVVLTLASGTGYNVGSPAAATGTITNDDSSGGIVRFSSAFYNTTEDSRFVTITVERVGDTSAAVTVDYATPDDSEATVEVPCATISGSASPRCDFTTALGTLRFAAGETSKTFTVLISQDNYVEGPETLALTLSNLTGGAVFGAPSTATLTIADDVTEPAENPIDDAENFVRQHYHDFLNREPDPSGLAFWRDQITACGTNQACIENRRIHVSAAFYLSIEFQGTGYFVERLYKSAYGDATGTSTIGGAHNLQVPVVRFSEFLLDTQEIGLGVIVGAPGWETTLENNKAAFVSRFVERSRFATEYPLSMTNAAFVDKLNTNAGNPLSPAERDQLVDDLTTAAKTRAQVVRAVAEDSDLVSAEFNRAFVLMQYFGYLRRNPNAAPDSDHTGFDFWLTKLNQFNGNFVNAEMVKAFITSIEYRRRSAP